MPSQTSPELKAQLAGLLETLNLLTAQAQAYERALPADNYQARAAVAIMGELARQALAEAQDLEAVLTVSILPSHPFSPRELEVLTLAAEGLSNKEIAYRLGLSERTIQFHMTSIFNKTGTNSRTEVTALALRQGWIRTG
jgi:DNA-binding NarL/FixJ family response regulator